MINLLTLFRNHFGTKSISDDKLKAFSEDHVQRMDTNNAGGLFTPLITDTTTAHASYFGSISSEATNKALQKAQTLQLDGIMTQFKEEASRREGLIKSLFGKDTPSYIEFYPQGISEYRGANKNNIETLMARMVNVATAHAAEVGSDFVTVFTEIQTRYTATRNAQMGKKGAVASDKTNTKEARTALELQLTKNLHFIAYTYPGDVNRCLAFFDQSIIQPRQSSATDGLGRITGVVTNATTSEPLVNASVEVVDTDIPAAVTSSEGRYRSRNVEVGEYTIRIVKSGYQTVEKTVEILDDGDTTLDVALTPA